MGSRPQAGDLVRRVADWRQRDRRLRGFRSGEGNALGGGPMFAGHKIVRRRSGTSRVLRLGGIIIPSDDHLLRLAPRAGEGAFVPMSLGDRGPRCGHRGQTRTACEHSCERAGQKNLPPVTVFAPCRCSATRSSHLSCGLSAGPDASGNNDVFSLMVAENLGTLILKIAKSPP